jgi:hypothetical protein
LKKKHGMYEHFSGMLRIDEICKQLAKDLANDQKSKWIQDAGARQEAERRLNGPGSKVLYKYRELFHHTGRPVAGSQKVVALLRKCSRRQERRIVRLTRNMASIL